MTKATIYVHIYSTTTDLCRFVAMHVGMYCAQQILGNYTIIHINGKYSFNN